MYACMYFFCVLYHHADTPFFDLGRLINQLPTANCHPSKKDLEIKDR